MAFPAAMYPATLNVNDARKAVQGLVRALDVFGRAVVIVSGGKF